MTTDQKGIQNISIPMVVLKYEHEYNGLNIRNQ